MAPNFWWFERRSAVALAWRIVVAVLTGRFKYLKVIPYTNAVGVSALKFRVVKKGDDPTLVALHDGTTHDVNDSHLCPIDCPD